jgi:tRNA wybutosine-synthesizing protein 3
MSLPPPALPLSFTNRKVLILSALSVPAEQYNDLSPKGSIDEGIRGLIEGINAREGWVTTSSCAGRVSVFVEGKRMRKETAGGEGQGKLEREVGSKGEGEETGVGGGEEDPYGEGNEDEDEVEAGDDHVDDDEDRSDVEKATKMKLAGAGGKGGGGRWLFVSHEPVDIDGVKGEDFSSFLGLNRMGDVMDTGRRYTEERLIHFKFEPMVRGFFRVFMRS